jgi:signal peptidase I
VVGIPGDEVAYLNKKLSINGQPVPTELLPEFFDESVMRYFKQSQEKLGNKPHHLIVDDERPAFIPGADDFAFRDQCNYTVEGVTCKVPAGHYFMMGDNRDNSLDSRYWGFVPDANIVGRAFFVWMNFGNLSRIGGFN